MCKSECAAEAAKKQQKKYSTSMLQQHVNSVNSVMNEEGTAYNVQCLSGTGSVHSQCQSECVYVPNGLGEEVYLLIESTSET